MVDGTFKCEVCGRAFVWKPQLAGKKARCKCGEPVRIPLDAPGASAAASPLTDDATGYALADSADDVAGITRDSARASDRATRCRSCNADLKPGAVVCVRCGTDQRTGERLRTDAAGAAPLGGGAGPAPVKSPAIGLALVEVALWCHLVGLAAMGVAILAGVAAIFSESLAVLAVAGFGGLASALLSLAGTLLLLFVPGEASARALLVGAIMLFLTSIGVEVAGEFAELPWYVTLTGGAVDWLGTVLFLMFLKQLAEYFGFQEMIENADKLIGLFLALSVLQFLAFFPIAGIFVLILSVYTFWLYVGLLVDLMRSAKHKRRHG